MSSTKKLTNLVAVKMGLAAKYSRLAKVACSDTKRERFRRQASYFARDARKLQIRIDNASA